MSKLIREHNKSLPLADYLLSFVGDKKRIRVLDIGSGPVPKIGRTVEGVEVEMRACDRRDYTNYWDKSGSTPLYPIEHQNMEALTFPDDTFDIIHCANALDHTLDAPQAVREMIRVCKPGGGIYINCWLIQHTTSGKMHYWDALEDGTFKSETDEFNIKDYGFEVELIDNQGERRYNQIIARYHAELKYHG